MTANGTEEDENDSTMARPAASSEREAEIEALEDQVRVEAVGQALCCGFGPWGVFLFSGLCFYIRFTLLVRLFV